MAKPQHINSRFQRAGGLGHPATKPGQGFRPGLLLTIAGLPFACWARILLGSNCNAVVQLKQNHERIDLDPCRNGRDPIHGGLLQAFPGIALALGQCRGALALAIVARSFWRNLRLQVRWLGEQFGAACADYMRRMRAPLPCIL